MAKGITETDVWQAADALLLEGARPTIERVRQKIGRGSPNTVTPYLETWFNHLGARIKDPGAFSAPSALPDAIHQVAQHLWEVALSEARSENKATLEAGLASAQAAEALAMRRVEAVEHQAVTLSARLQRAESELAAAHDAATQEALVHSATQAHLDTARQQLADMTDKLQIAESQVKASRDEAKVQVDSANARADAAEKRAALDMDRERVARSLAEKRLAALDAKLEATAAALSSERVQHASEVARLRSEIDQLGRERLPLHEKLKQAHARLEVLSKELASAEAHLEATRLQASDTRELLTKLTINELKVGSRRQNITKAKRPE